MGPEAERILEAGTTAMRPPQGAKRRGWDALQGRIAEPTPRPRWALPLVAALALAAAIALVWSLASSRAVVADRSADEQALDRGAASDEPRVIVERVDAPTIPAPTSEPVAEPEQVPAESPRPVARPRPSPAAIAGDPLAEAAAILHAGDAALADGRFAAALGHARAHARRFPEGALAEDAAALEITALCRLGRVDDAAVAAAAMERRFPTSAVARRLAETSCRE
jgi:hypothetical protein